MSTRQAYPALPPKRGAKCDGCGRGQQIVKTAEPGHAYVTRLRLKLVYIDGQLGRLCDSCRKIARGER